MTAGAQRYATLWSGDIYPNHQDMEAQVRGMQLAGLSGFPYWGHDAGGFFDWQAEKGPDADLYQQWAMAFGSFSPIWKPHGMGHSRWPLDRTEVEQQSMHKYAHLRYQLMPYLYTAAHQAAQTGLPIARAMILDYQDSPQAWRYDLQYMWGDNILVAPNTSVHNEKRLWLPPGQWFEFQSNQKQKGDKEITVDAAPGMLPMYVKAGAIIPKREYALSTAFIDKSKLIIDLYVGADGDFTLVEDDDRTEAYRQKGERMTTVIRYDHKRQEIVIDSAQGQYADAPKRRTYQVNIYGAPELNCIKDGNKKLTLKKTNEGALGVELPKKSIQKPVTLSFCS